MVNSHSACVNFREPILTLDQNLFQINSKDYKKQLLIKTTKLKIYIFNRLYEVSMDKN